MLRVIREILLHIGVCAAYLCVAIIGLRTDATNHTEPLVWLPIGFALGTFLIGGLRFLPALLAAAWLAFSWLSVIPVGGGLLAATTSATVPALVAWFVRRIAGFDPSLDRVSDLGWVLVVAIPVTCALDALGVTTAFRLVAEHELDAGELWVHWMLAEVVGATILTPAMLLAFSVPMGAMKARRWIELVLLVSLLTLASMLAIYKPDLRIVGPLAAVGALPIGVTIAIRFDRLGAAVIGLVGASVLLVAAVTGDGPFNATLSDETSRRALGLWGVALALQTMAVLLGVSVASNRRKTAEVASVAGRLRLVVDAARLGYWQMDLALRTTHANARLEAMLGEPAATLIGRSIFDIALPAHRESLQRAIDRTLDGEACDIEIECMRPDVSTAWLGLHLSAFVDERGSRRGVIAAVEDLADRRRSEDERLRLETNVLQAQRLESLGVLSGGIAHDFNNIVMGIRGNAGLLRLREGEGEGVRDAADRIDAACERAAGLVSTLLAYAGRGPFSPERVSVAKVLREAHGIVTTSAPRNARIELAPIAATLEIDADPQHLRQMFVSILTNALEALPPTGGNVRAGAVEENGHVTVTITDDGAGMDHQTVAKAFEPFFTTKGVGRGLGLSASQGIAQRLGGSIELESAPSHGTIVTIRLPTAPIGTDVQPLTSPAKDDAQQRPLAIVAETDSAVRDLVLAALQVRGFLVSEQRSLRESLRPGPREPALIVASSGQSVIETLETVRLARAGGCETPIVLTTERHETIVLHPQDPRTVWLSQPFGVRAFLDAVDAARHASLPTH
ncbi:MAG: MASE1 domain-containing protein [Phycisphaerae bacterium]|jgi:PAS domain S-box-containing protein|nr:MASE1 domain-containing protein [Phycisphaerae bacterium]